ncbi:DNA repair protein RecO [Oceanobacillus piezotolerans]|uniref:DNA repair protein RecO n=1 Tax=Oceanobacillus piezotolerans TaxID=2448030 RepID=A0A498DAP1_9BACI|nr:DNA repair protein RecO [Oceanobacillus piezotolerans]RLL48051.1 DNA repair protein RecO [Oceanobacillus piezotolerans]
MLEKIDGIIVKTKDYSETHKLVTIFSKRLGKFTALARGAKKPRSRMAAVAQPFIYAQFFVYVNKGLSTIQQGEVIDSFRSIREDIIKTAYAAYIMELTDKILEDKSPDAFIFDQCLKTMQWIGDKEDAEIPIMMYEMKLYKKGGFAPSVRGCSNCKNTEGPFWFSYREGGLLCSRCNHLDQEATLLPEAIPKLLYMFLEVGLERVGNISVKDDNQRILRHLLDSYYDQYGGFYLKSRKFLKQLDKFR